MISVFNTIFKLDYVYLIYLKNKGENPMKPILFSLSVLTLLLGACSENEETIEEMTDEGQETTQDTEIIDTEEVDEPEVEPITHTKTISTEDEEYELELVIHPIKRSSDISVFTIEFSVNDGQVSGGDLHRLLTYPLTTSNGPGGFDELGYQIRLIDSTHFTASHTLFYQEQNGGRIDTYPVRTDTSIDILSLSDDGESVTYQALFTSPLEDTVHALIGNIGFIENIPVLNTDEAQATAESLLTESIPDDTTVSINDLSEQVYPLQTYTESFTIPVGTLTEEEQATITLASDILFDFDSADLQDTAKEIIQATGNELSRVDMGNLLIVGHTDNEGSEEYNNVLSEERAETVLNQLEDLVDLSQFDSIETEGRAFHEPIASNDNEDGRALNRRVELHFTPPAERIEVVDEGTELPESHGPVMEYAEGEVLEVELEGSTYGISIDSLQRIDGFIIGQLEIHSFEGNQPYASSLVNSGLYSGSRRINRQETGGSIHDADGVTLLHGDQRIFPIDYWALTARGSWELGSEELYPLADRSVNWFSDSDVLPVTIIWPDVPADTITLDIGPTDEYDQADYLIGSILGTVAWRIENVPIDGYNTEDFSESDEDSEEDSEEDETENEEDE